MSPIRNDHMVPLLSVIEQSPEWSLKTLNLLLDAYERLCPGSRTSSLTNLNLDGFQVMSDQRPVTSEKVRRTYRADPDFIQRLQKVRRAREYSESLRLPKIK